MGAEVVSQRTVAIVGASADPAKFGYQSVVAHQRQGYQVFPVNPKGGQIAGLKVYARLADVPAERLDRISIYLPPRVALDVMEEIAAKPCDELFFNPGSDSPEVIEAARNLGLEPIQACSIVNVGSGEREGGE